MTVHAAGACTLLWVRRRTAVSGPGLCGPRASLGGEGDAWQRNAVLFGTRGRRLLLQEKGNRESIRRQRSPLREKWGAGHAKTGAGQGLPMLLAGSAGLCQRNLCKKNSSCKAARSYTLAPPFIQYPSAALLGKRKSPFSCLSARRDSLPNFHETARVSIRQTVWSLCLVTLGELPKGS